MKKTLSILLITAMVCTMGSALFGCNRNSNNDETRRPTVNRPSIVGLWEAMYCCCTIFEVEFRADGTWIFTEIWDYGAELIERLSWRIGDDRLFIYDYNDYERLPFILDGNTLIVDGYENTRIGDGSGLVGTWQIEDEWGKTTVELRANGVGFSRTVYNSNPSDYFISYGFWDAEDNMLILTPVNVYWFDLQATILTVDEISNEAFWLFDYFPITLMRPQT